LVLLFRKEQDSSFSEEKEAKRLLFFSVAFEDTGFGRIATQDQVLPVQPGGLAITKNLLS
jgi:hypothetical protein